MAADRGQPAASADARQLNGRAVVTRPQPRKGNENGGNVPSFE